MAIHSSRLSSDSSEGMFSRKALLALIIPLAIEQTFTALMGMADTLMVSNIGEGSISGVSCVDAINVLILMIFEALALGGNVICAHYIGQQDKEGIRELVMQFMLFLFLLSLLVMIPFLLWPAWILSLIYPSMGPEILGPAVVYTRITALSFPFISLYSGSAALYRSIGNPRLPVTIITIGNILNVLGNAVLIFVFRLGVSGAAWSTTFSRIFCCLVILYYQSRKGQLISLSSLRGIRFRPEKMVSVLRVGLPTAAENGMFQLGKILVQSLIVSLGTSMTAAQAIIVQVEGLASRPASGIAVALLTITGQCIGAGKPQQAREYTRRLAVYAYICCIITGVLTVAITPWVCSMTALTPEAVRMVIYILIFISVSKVFLWPGSFLYINTLKGAGDVRYPMVVSIASMWICRVFGAYFFCTFTTLGLWGVWFGWIADWLFRTVFFIYRFRKGSWMEIHLV